MRFNIQVNAKFFVSQYFGYSYKDGKVCMEGQLKIHEKKNFILISFISYGEFIRHRSRVGRRGCICRC